MSHKPALVLLSGGLDSVTALAWARQNNYPLKGTISFVYGQRHVREIESAAAVAAYYGLPHQVVTLTHIEGSSLTGLGNIPQERDLASLSEAIAPTYVPNRNMILLAYAAAQAMLEDVTDLIGGWNAADALNYPDCREEFLESIQQTLRLATLHDFAIVRPLIRNDKQTIVRCALDLRAPLHLTWTCYLGGERACGRCDACQLRIGAFQKVGVIDPISYTTPIDWSGCQPYTEQNI